MRKFLLSTVALMMSVALMAAGLGNGTSKANAIDFDWANGHIQAAGTASWYRVSLSQLKKDAYDPTLALYLTNLTTEKSAVTLSVDAELVGQQFSKAYNYQIASKDYQLWSVRSFSVSGSEISLKNLMQYGLEEVYVQLKANKEIALTAKVYETEDIVDDACSKAVDFDWAGVTVPAGEKWFRLNLAEVKNSDNQLKFVVANNGAADAHVAFDMSLDCPASAVIEKDWVIAAGAEQEDEFGRIFLDVLKEDYVFLKLTNDQPLTLSVEEEILVVEPGKYDDFTCDAPMLEFSEELNLTAGKHIYKVKREDLLGGRSLATEFYVTNQTATPANLTVETAFACPVKSTVDQNLVIDANATVVKAIKDNVLKAVNSEWVYIRFITDQDLTASVGKRNIDPCATATKFDWTVGAKLEAGASKWYEMDITSLKQNKQHLKLAFYNHADSRALVSVELALECNGTILPITLPVPAGLSISQVIDYQLLKRSPLDRIYLSVSTDQDIELAASVKDAIAADQTPCLNALNPEHGVEYVHEANTTSWYKISLDLLKSTDKYSSFYLANKGNQRAHVTIGLVTDCMYTTGAQLTIPLPAGLELGALAPNIIGNLIEELTRFESAYNKVDSKDVYLELHSDQPIHFGLDVVNETTSPCLREDLVTFDWNKGAKVEAHKAAWYDLDLTAVKGLGKHVKLTFTNHADSIVWATTVVSVDCPAKLTMPLLVPVRAGMSADVVVDYSFFAAVNLDNLYLGVLTDGPLELAATTIDATATDPTGCDNAVEVKSGVEYKQTAGTKWYQFPMSLLDEMGEAAAVSIKNLGSQTAHLTAGVTVNCAYSIAHRAPIKLPRELNMSLNVPKRLINAARKFINADVDNFYMQLTTDQAIAFSLNMQSVDVNACAAAVDFDWAAWEQDGLKLQANQDVWYKVSLDYPLKKLENGEDIIVSVVNDSEADVEVSVAMSPTCPAFVCLEKFFNIPAKGALKKVLTYAEVVSLLERYDKYVFDGDPQKIVAQLEAYGFFNKLNSIIGKYDLYVSYDKVQSLLARYDKYISYTGVKELIVNYDKYLTVAELKQQLAKVKDHVSYDQLISLIDKYGEHIPYVDAKQLIDQYGPQLAGGAAVIVDQCKKYVSVADLKKALNHLKSYIPFEELKALFNKIEKYLPVDNTCYVRIRTEGDLVVDPDLPTPPECVEQVTEYNVTACESYEWKGMLYEESGTYYDTLYTATCEDAEWLDWKQPVKLSEFTAPWYKIDVTDIVKNNADFTMTFDNDLGEAKQISLDLHYYCSEDGEGFIAGAAKLAEPGITTRTISYDQYEESIDTDYDVLYLHNINGDCGHVEVLNLTINESVKKTIKETFCESYKWNDSVYTIEGVYKQTFTAANGCDSIVTLVLTEKCDTVPPTPECDTIYTEFSDTFCKSYTWNSEVYTVAGDYTQTFLAINGCDSIVTLHLTEDCGVVPPTPEDNPCKNAILFDWTTGAFLAGGESQWYEFNITSLIDNQQHVTLTFINHSDSTAWVHTEYALDCDGKIVPMLLPIPAGLSVSQTIDYQILSRSPLRRLYVGVETDQDIELRSSVKSAIADDQTPCLNAKPLEYDVEYVHEPGTTWYKVSMEMLKNDAEALRFAFANKGNKRANVTIGMVADCQYTTGTTVTLPIPGGVEMNVLAPNVINKLMEELASFEKAFNEWEGKEIYFEVTTDQTLEFSVKSEENNQACASATELNWDEWETNGIQLHANEEVWYKLNAVDLLEKLHKEDHSITIALSNLDTVAVDVELMVSPTCPVMVSLDKVFTVPASVSVKKTFSSEDVMQWLKKHDEYVPYEQIKLFVDKYADHPTVAEIKDMVKNYEKYLSVEKLKEEVAKHKEHISYETVKAALDKYGKYVPYVDVKALFEKYEETLVVYAGFAAIVLDQCEQYITTENLLEVIDYCKPHIPYEELKRLVEMAENAVRNYEGYLRVKTTGELHIGPNPIVPECTDVVTETTVEACGAYEWKGVLYTESGDYEEAQPLTTPEGAEFIDWTQPIKLSTFTEPWYKLDISEAIANKSDVTLLIENDFKETQEVTLALHDEMVEMMYSATVKVKPGVHPKTITYDEVDQMIDLDQTSVLYLRNVNFDCDRVEVLHLTIVDCHETIEALVCDGDEFVDPTTNVEHLISSLVPSTLTWTDEIVGEHKEVSKYTYVITPIVAPAAMTAEILATIPGATPGLTQGLMPELAGTVEAIKAYYEANDAENISDVVNVYWETVAVACGATTHTMTLVVEDDCDNVVKSEITLSVEPIEVVEETAVACDSYEWNGTTYTSSGDYSYTATNANGCEYEMILHLTIHNSEAVEETVTACDSYEWHGQTYTESGDYTFNTTTADGCDRVETLHLTINKSVVGITESKEICPGETYTWNGVTYAEAGTYTVTLTAANGCDSVATLVLAIPDPENDATKYDNIAAVSKYGGRLLVLDLKKFASINGFTPAEADVKWYELNGEMDAAVVAAAQTGDDIEVGTGYYFNLPSGEIVAGKYYAMVSEFIEGMGCDALYRTEVLGADTKALAPILAPNAVRADEEVRILNLDPTTVNVIRVYNMTGELMTTFTADYVSEFVFKAASFSGYYMVEIENAFDKVTLRYVVK